MNYIYLVLFLFTAIPLFGDDAKNSAVLKELTSKMGNIKTLQCNFVQEKKLKVFKRPIIIKGQIFLKAPNHFSWRTLSPIRYSLVIIGTKLSQWDEDSNTVLNVDLADKPAFKVILRQMNAWFIGDYSKLTTEYIMEIIQEKPLIIQFVPKNQKAVPLQKITVSFFKNLSYVHSIYIVEKSGDTVNIKFSDVILNKAIPEQAWDPEANVK